MQVHEDGAGLSVFATSVRPDQRPGVLSRLRVGIPQPDVLVAGMFNLQCSVQGTRSEADHDV